MKKCKSTSRKGTREKRREEIITENMSTSSIEVIQI